MVQSTLFAESSMSVRRQFFKNTSPKLLKCVLYSALFYCLQWPAVGLSVREQKGECYKVNNFACIFRGLSGGPLKRAFIADIFSRDEDYNDEMQSDWVLLKTLLSTLFKNPMQNIN